MGLLKLSAFKTFPRGIQDLHLIHLPSLSQLCLLNENGLGSFTRSKEGTLPSGILIGELGDPSV